MRRAPGGVFLNGDEVRPEDDGAYRAECEWWAAHMHRAIDSGKIPPAMCDALRKWEDRNVTRFGSSRQSGDDIHETAATQLSYLTDAGFVQADTPWQQKLWTLLRGVKQPCE